MHDDVSHFDCGVSSLNTWLQNHAWKNQQTGVSRTNVICTRPEGRIAGFVSMSTAVMERAALPRRDRHGKPDPIPLTLLGQLAVDRHHTGRSLGRSLLFFALKTALAMSEHIGSYGVLTHPVNTAARSFYLHYGFEDIPHDERGGMLLRMQDIRAAGF